MIDVKNNGFEFIGFINAGEEEINNFKPIAGSYAVVKYDDKYLICYNTLRNQWELPAGKREQNETPKKCAIRELYEETGQVVSDLEFKGLLKVKNIMTGKIKFNPVFHTTSVELQPFKENDETSEIKLWDLKEKIGLIDSVDVNIFKYV
ncbi:NUDIX hydrolase [Bacillaceae bacterium SIJ1]|uniref:NUDIX domain-containing protein n=1 Tax=Litoribacterium kuwaitense TaxID=1398745 RepID=UPI0013EB2568|nr:NUDIX hydrolase [Litoribacterium kuwaitense]NGP46926.1 NUDIX hydrolase [Litoribacterium kuwaitense]